MRFSLETLTTRRTNRREPLGPPAASGAAPALLASVCLVAVLAAAGCGGEQTESGDGFRWPEKLLSAPQKHEESSVKLERLRTHLETRGLCAAVIAAPGNLAWLNAGEEAGKGVPAAAVVLADGRRFLVAGHSTLERLLREEFRHMDYEGLGVPWHMDLWERVKQVVAESCGDRAWVSDTALAGGLPFGVELAGLQVPLTPTEIDRYRWLGRRAAEAVESVCRGIRPGMTERGVESLVAAALRRAAIQPEIIGVGADERLAESRRPVTTDLYDIRDHVRISVHARRWGLGVSLTRSVHFGPVPDELRRRYAAAAQVAAGLWARTVAGNDSGDVLQGAIADYAGEGFAGEWERHDFGGGIGYSRRDWLALPGSSFPIASDRAFAWNPSLPGVFLEDTILLDGERLVVLTWTGEWPVLERRALGRRYRVPDMLVRDIDSPRKSGAAPE